MKRGRCFSRSNSAYNGAARSCVGKRRTIARLLVFRLFLGQQNQQYFVSILVPRQIMLALGNQPFIKRDAFVVDEMLHFGLPSGQLQGQRLSTGYGTSV